MARESEAGLLRAARRWARGRRAPDCRGGSLRAGARPSTGPRTRRAGPSRCHPSAARSL